MKLNPSPVAVWHQEAASLLGVTAQQLAEVVPTKILFKKDLEKVIQQLQLGQEAIDKLEARLPGPFGRG